MATTWSTPRASTPNSGARRATPRLCDAVREHGLGQLLDLVPNHMAIIGRENPWWWDVLQNGPASRYATFFDVDWDASGERWPNKMLLPVLGDHYGRVLEDGQLQLTHHDGEFVLHYHEHVFPIDPSSLAGLLGQAADHCGVELLAFLAESHAPPAAAGGHGAAADRAPAPRRGRAGRPAGPHLPRAARRRGGHRRRGRPPEPRPRRPRHAPRAATVPPGVVAHGQP